MTESKVSGAGRLRPRRWAFAACLFDEASWSLSVDGQRVPVETKPLELLRELLAQAGRVVTKDELLDRIWPNVTVVEASLPTAVRKLRVALGDDRRERSIIVTVPGIGYRLGVPVEVEEQLAVSVRPVSELAPGRLEEGREAGAAAAAIVQAPARNRVLRLFTVAGGMAIAFVAFAAAFTPSQNSSATTAPRAFTQRDAENALRRLDIGKIEQMLAAGWNPNPPFDNEGNPALNYLLNMCEWDRNHDRRRMVLMARTLIEGGALLDHHNRWGDSPYSIAKAERYCGPDHPVTQMIRTTCYAGFRPLGDRCLAYYETAARPRGRVGG
jgi:DNA-binding winged helix-turn-helix (wHTH) protein